MELQMRESFCAQNVLIICGFKGQEFKLIEAMRILKKIINTVQT